MKRFCQILSLTLLLTAGNLLVNASGKSKVPHYGKTNIADMVLIYHGAINRPIEWNKDQFLALCSSSGSARKEKTGYLTDSFLLNSWMEKGITLLMEMIKQPWHVNPNGNGLPSVSSKKIEVYLL